MPSFDVADGPTEIPLAPDGGGWTGSTGFTVTSHNPEKVNARLAVRPTGNADAGWFDLAGEPLRTLDGGQTIAATVTVRVPAGTAAGRGGLSLRIINENDSNNDWADSGERFFDVPSRQAPPPAQPKPKRRFPWIIAVLVVILIAAVAIWSARPDPVDPVMPVPTPEEPTPPPTPEPVPEPEPTPAPLAEDCIGFGSPPPTVANIGGRWKIVSGSHWVFDFGDSQSEADQAMAVISKYGASQTCYVGRPDPSLTYLRNTSGGIPRGPAPGEDCVTLNVSALDVRPIGSVWSVVSGGNHLAFSAPNEAEARQIIAVLQHYRPTHACYVGRPDPSLSYLRRGLIGDYIIRDAVRPIGPLVPTDGN